MLKGVESLPDSDRISQLLGVPVQAVTPCISGGNNRVFRVETAQQTYLEKQYFYSDADQRNRLTNEWQFLTYAAQFAVPHVPRPIAKDEASNLAVYSFLDGSRPLAITRDMVAQAGDWIASLNRENRSPLAQNLAVASEACFTLNDHLALLHRRMEVLISAAAHASSNGLPQEVFANMQSAMAHYGDAAITGYAALGLAPEDRLSRAAQCLSPSDFGFHNSLVLADGTVQFLDFEYAGWDDPAKMICDFFLHPGMAVDAAWVDAFWQRAKAIDSNPDSTLARARLLYPLLGLRWCCIILNVFVPEWAARRQFANANWDRHAAQEQQLEKARNMLERITHHPF